MGAASIEKLGGSIGIMNSESSVTVTIKLSRDAAKALKRPLAGQGGFQSAIRRVQEMLGEDDIIALGIDDIAYLVGLATRYRQGGFQARLRVVLDDLAALAQTLRPLQKRE